MLPFSIEVVFFSTLLPKWVFTGHNRFDIIHFHMFYPQTLDYYKYNPCTESPLPKRHSIDQKEEMRMFANHYCGNLTSLAQVDNLCYFLSLWSSPRAAPYNLSSIFISSESAPWWMWKHSATSTVLMCGFCPPLRISLCWIFFCFLKAPADKTCRQQCTSLTDRAPCSQQGNPGLLSSHTLFIKCSVENAVCVPQAEAERSLMILRGPTYSLLPIFPKVGERAYNPWYCIERPI